MKKMWFATSLAAVVLMSGCGDQSAINQNVLEKSGIEMDTEYQQYVHLSEEGRLTEDGYYEEKISDDMQKIDYGTGNVEVAFAENPYLNIFYYTDAQMTNKIGGSYYKFNAGDSVYASVVSSNPVSDAYSLKEFRIVEWGETERKEIACTELIESKLVFTIPTDYTGQCLMILPVGEYHEKEIELTAYSIDSHGTRMTLRQAGEWYVNEAEVDGDVVAVGAEEAYTISYDFDESEYFFVSSYPKQFNELPNEDGKVIFEKVVQGEDIQSYEVELCKYLELEIEFPASAVVTFKGATEDVRKNKSWKNEYLEYGDVISIETAEVPIVKGDYQHIEVIHDPDSEKYDLKVVRGNLGNSAEGILEVVSVERVFELILNPECEYGVCTFELDGEEVSGTVMAKENQELRLICKITNPNYMFVKEKGGVVDSIKNVVSFKKQTKTVLVTSAMDGEVVSVDGYFEVEKKEG